MHRITLPESLTLASLARLEADLEAATRDAGARVFALAGASETTFCRGMDLAAMAGAEGDALAALSRFAGCVARLRRAPRPTIALVDGEALGGGVGLLAACDFVAATSRATFGLPEALFGLLPAVVMPVLLERMSPQRARLLTLEGTKRDAAWALAMGLVEAVVEPADLEKTAKRAARDLSRVHPDRVGDLRAWMAEIPTLPGERALERGAAVTAALVGDAQVREAVRGFVEEGRAPWLAR